MGFDVKIFPNKIKKKKKRPQYEASYFCFPSLYSHLH